MSAKIDLSDVPPVAPEHLAMPMRFLVESGRGLVMLRGLSRADLDELETVIWPLLEGDIVYRRAVLLRFQCMVDAFTARRLRGLLLRRGYGLIWLAVRLAASARLNAKWGFNPMKLAFGLQAASQTGHSSAEMLEAA
jgi:hypothetical protein